MISDFRLIYVRHNRTEGITSLPDAPIPFHDLTFVLKGSLSYVLDGAEITVTAGSALWAPEGTFRARKPAPKGSAEYVAFNFLSGEEYSLPSVIEACVEEEIPLLLAAVDQINEKPYLSGERKIEQILKCLLLSLQSRVKERAEHPLVTRIKRYLYANLKEKITLSDVAAQTYFSPAYCEGVFKKETGLSVIEYLLKERIRRAKRLLTEGALSLTEVGLEVGFPDYNYFSRTFKKRVGVSPGAYKKAHARKG